MTSLTDTQVVTASGGLVELGYGQITSSVVVTSTSFTTPTTVIPDVTVVCDGSPILVEFYAPQTALSSGQSQIVFALWEDGAEKYRYWHLKTNPTGSTGVDYDGVKAEVRLTPSAGSHTYRVVAFSSPANNSVLAGNATTSNSPAFLRVSKIVQATQWPAVTTGTIICTSSTRPASPFEGQKIYETDTGLSLIYDGSAWVSPSVTHKPPSVKLERTTGQVVYDASGATMVWDSEAWDTDAMHDNATNQDRITINTPGIYLVIGAVRYTVGISDDSSLTINLNGSLVVRDEGGPANTAGGRTASVMLNVNANDYLTMQVYQNNSANTSRTTTSGTFFSAAWIGQA
ncbi:MAG: hypothetical protein VW438_00075 [Euryarchaeota archaeon]